MCPLKLFEQMNFIDTVMHVLGQCVYSAQMKNKNPQPDFEIFFFIIACFIDYKVGIFPLRRVKCKPQTFCFEDSFVTCISGRDCVNEFSNLADPGYSAA